MNNVKVNQLLWRDKEIEIIMTDIDYDENKFYMNLEVENNYGDIEFSIDEIVLNQDEELDINLCTTIFGCTTHNLSIPVRENIRTLEQVMFVIEMTDPDIDETWRARVTFDL